MNATEAQLAKLRAHLSPTAPACPHSAADPERLRALRAATAEFPNPADYHDAADLLLPLQRRNAAGVSAVLDRCNPAERLGVLHALVDMLHDAQDWSQATTPEGMLAAAVHLSLNP